jgi:hypothetical protein
MSPSGSDDIADCTPPTTSGTTTSASTSTHEVRITLSLPMSQSAFTKDKQTSFKVSLAQAAGVASEAVVINKIESISSRRHLLAEAIRVETSIMALGQTAAEEMAGRLTAENINIELSKAGLPTIIVLESAKVVAVAEATVASSSSIFSTPVLVGGILGIVFLAGTVACFGRGKCKNHITAQSREMGQAQAPEEITLVTAANGTLGTLQYASSLDVVENVLECDNLELPDPALPFEEDLGVAPHETSRLHGDTFSWLATHVAGVFTWLSRAHCQ